MKSLCHIDILTWLATALRILLALCKPSRFYSLQQISSFHLEFSSGNWHNVQNWNAWCHTLKCNFVLVVTLCQWWQAVTCENVELFLVWEYFAMNNDTGYCCWLLLRWLKHEDDEIFLVKYSLFSDLIVWFWLHLIYTFHN